jgi:hypothetical protein
MPDKLGLQPASHGLLLELFLYPEYRGDMFLLLSSVTTQNAALLVLIALYLIRSAMTYAVEVVFSF